MTKRKISRVLNSGLAFLTALQVFSSPIYAKETRQESPKKNIDYLIDKEQTNYKEEDKNEPTSAFSFNEFYMVTRANRLDDGLYSELSYENNITKRLSWETAVGYTKLNAKDVSDNRTQRLEVIPTYLGLKYRILGPLSFKGGLSHYKYHIDKMKIPSEYGGYVGLELGSEKEDISFSLEVRAQTADMDIEYPILEDETNFGSIMFGGGLKLRF